MRHVNWLRQLSNWISNLERYGSNLVSTIRAFGLVVTVFLFGTLGYYFLGDGEISLFRCAYMTVITLTTVGYGEMIDLSLYPGMRAFTIVLIVTGMGTVLYFASSFTAFIVDGELRKLIRRRGMEKQINSLDNHFVIAGIGQTGEYVLSEMLTSRRDVVVLDQDPEAVERVREDLEFDFPHLIGDATDDDVLKEVGIDRAKGLVCSLGSDRDNLFVTISARRLNPDLRIITRGYHPEAREKFQMAGADSVIFTNILGGMRMAAEAIRPEVTTFLDLMMKDHGHYRRVEEIEVPEDSPLAGKTIGESAIRQHTDALIIAIGDPETETGEYNFNPGPDHVIRSGSKLIVLTLIEDVETLEKIVRGEASHAAGDWRTE